MSKKASTTKAEKILPKRTDQILINARQALVQARKHNASEATNRQQKVEEYLKEAEICLNELEKPSKKS